MKLFNFLETHTKLVSQTGIILTILAFAMIILGDVWNAMYLLAAILIFAVAIGLLLYSIMYFVSLRQDGVFTVLKEKLFSQD